MSRFALIAVAYTAVQLFLILFVGYGPFRDEAFYITAGLQFWNGDGSNADFYLNSFNGSPYAWPLLGGGLYRIGGLAAARIGAFLCIGTGIVFAFKASERLVGPVAAVAGVAVVLSRGSGLMLGHYATYDPLAFAFLGLSLWGVARWVDAPSWRWAALAGLALWAAAMSKYPFAIMGLPLVAVMATRADAPRVRHGLVLTLTAALPFFASMRLMFGSWIPPTLSGYQHASFPRVLVLAVMALYIAIPLACLVWGLRRSSTPGAPSRSLLLVGLATALLWPLLHVYSGQIASAFKHVWIGLVVAVPAIGFGAQRFWEESGPRLRALGVATLIVVGAVEWAAFERLTYPNFRPSVEFLMESMDEDDRVFVIGDNDRWVYAMFLYGTDRIATPSEIVDQGGSGTEDVCAYSWIVATRTDVTGPVRDDGWPCRFELAFEKEQRFLNYRGEFDVQRFQIWSRGGEAR